MASARGRELDEQVLRATLDEVGDPETVAASYAPQSTLVGPDQFRAFLVWTAVAFAVHLALIGVATGTGHALQVGPVAVAPTGDGGIVGFSAAVAHALLLDVGLMVVLFAGAPRVARYLRPFSLSLGVDAAPRTAGGRAVLAILVGSVLWFFGDRVFVVMNGPEAHPLFTPWFTAMLPLVLGLLALAVVSDVLYVVLGERRSTLALDACHGAATVATMIHLQCGDTLLRVPPVAAFADTATPINGFLENLSTLVVVAVAAIAAVKTVRRLARCAQV
jgi:hypothetical protein